MTESGLKIVTQAKENGSWSQFDVVEGLVTPQELDKEFVKNKKAKDFFESLTVSQRKQILYYIYSAKQTPTRDARAKKVVESLTERKRPF